MEKSQSIQATKSPRAASTPSLMADASPSPPPPPDKPDAGIALADRRRDVSRPVGGIVIDDNNLDVLSERPQDRADQRADVLALVERGEDDGEQGAFGHQSTNRCLTSVQRAGNPSFHEIFFPSCFSRPAYEIGTS